MEKEKIISLLLRFGIAFSFIYVAVSAFLNPTNWLGFIPDFLTFGFNKELFLKFHATIDLILGLWLISGRKPFYASILSSIILFGIIILNIGSMEIIFRDVSILLMAIAFSVVSYKQKL